MATEWQAVEIIDDDLFEIPLTTSLSCFFMLLVIVLGGIFVYITEFDWDLHTTIKRRFVFLAMVMLVAAFIIFSSPQIPKILGNRIEGLWQFVPLSYAFITMILLAPVLVNLQNNLHI